jgi:hypothetical protein
LDEAYDNWALKHKEEIDNRASKRKEELAKYVARVPSGREISSEDMTIRLNYAVKHIPHGINSAKCS